MNTQPGTEENLIAKKNLYSKANLELFNKNMNSSTDLQGWRNKLIDVIPKNNNSLNIVDLGCGLGDKSLRLINNFQSQFENLYLIDYSPNSTKIFKDVYKGNNVKFIHSDVISALDMIENNSLDIIIAFGFIHEIKERKLFLSKLKSKMHDKSLFIISDNDRFYTANELDFELKKYGINNCVYKKVFNLFNIHLFSRISQKKGFPKFFLNFHKDRSDNIVSFTDEYFNNIKNIFKYDFW